MMTQKEIDKLTLLKQEAGQAKHKLKDCKENSRAVIDRMKNIIFERDLEVRAWQALARELEIGRKFTPKD